MIHRHSLSIGIFLFLIDGLIVTAGFAVLLGMNITALRNTTQDQTENNLRSFAYALTPLVGQHESDIDRFTKEMAGANPNFRITVIAQDGVVIADSDAADIAHLENHGARSEVKAALSGSEGKSVRRSTVNNKDVMYYAVPVTLNGAPCALRLSMPVDTSVYFSTNVRRNIIIAGILVLVAIIIVTFVVSAYIVRQIKELQHAAVSYRAGNFDYQPAVSSPRELRELGETQIAMAQEIKKDIASITQKRDEFQAVFSGITEGLIVFDTAMNVLETNSAAQTLFGSSGTQRQTLAQFVCNADILSYVSLITTGDARETSAPPAVDQTHLPDDDRIADAALSASDGIETVVHTGGGDRIIQVHCVSIGRAKIRGCYLLIVSDITRLKHLEQVRKDFVANVSHELKTPVTSIKGFAETLVESPADEETTRRFLGIINAQSGRLMNIINDLLTLSRLEQENEHVETIRTNVCELASSVCESFQAAAKEKGVTVTFVNDTLLSSEDAAATAAVNPGLFEQALGNIIDNAIKYCPSGANVTCTVRDGHGEEEKEWQVANGKWGEGKEWQGANGKREEREETKDNGHEAAAGIEIVVMDDGPGIPSQYRERIFERFFRVDKGRSRETGGTGLGLSISAHIIALFGGTIQETGRTDGKSGARFVVTLPPQSDK